MRLIYLILFTASATLLLLGSIITFAVPIEESFAARLVQVPEQWDIIFLGKDPMGISIAKDTHTAKTLLLRFLTKNRLPTYARIGHIGYDLLIICAFSLVGLIRESRLKKNKNAEPAG